MTERRSGEAGRTRSRSRRASDASSDPAPPEAPEPPFRLDHVVVLVHHLERAIEDYRALGFTVLPGGVHAGGATHNALVVFADGSYLELIALTRRWQAMALPWLRRIGMLGAVLRRKGALEARFLRRGSRGGGAIDFALLPDDLNAALDRARASGVMVEGPIPGGRVRPDGEPVTWEMAIPRSPELPFLCSDLTPRELRVPSGDASTHANGASGIASVQVAVDNLEASSARYRAFLGSEPQPGPPTAPTGSRGRSFRLAGADITLLSPSGVSPALRRHLQLRGDSPFAVQIRAEVGIPSRSLEPARTHGVRLELVR